MSTMEPNTGLLADGDFLVCLAALGCADKRPVAMASNHPSVTIWYATSTPSTS
ncbi:MAG: hypothetical protein ACRENE_00095 [Polyangiaceae bacterium]